MTAPAPRVKRRASSETTRTRLVEAATDLFLDQGYDVRLQDVARKAGLTTGAIYSNFPDKSGLFVEVMRQASVDLARRMAGHRRPTNGARSPRSRLAGRLGARLLRRPPSTSVLLLEALIAARRHEEVRDLAEKRIDRWTNDQAAIIDQAKEAGEIDPDLSTAALVRLAQALTLGSFLLESVGTDKPAPEEWNAVIDRLLAGLDPA